MSKIETVKSNPNPGTTKENNRELTAEELDAVSGGNLLEACAKGKVFKSVEIHGTA
jgi:hypothetical protein